MTIAVLLAGLAIATGLAKASPPPLTVVTWNVLGELADAEARATEVVRVLGAQKADIIAIQEASPSLLAKLVSAPWFRDGNYQGIARKRHAVAPLGLYIASRYPLSELKIEALPSMMQRMALTGTITVGQRAIRFAIVHLDSHLYMGPTRARQLDHLRQVLGDGDRLLLGDLNFGDGEPETLLIPPGLDDPWARLNKDAPGFTWDVVRNPRAKAGCLPGEGSRRLDRVLWALKGYEARSASLIGTTPGVDGGFPSDHFGLRVALHAPP
ncbi:MAG: endonuclease/exonuclease/phosphatase family metal-dependent hydrolase [Myxococcota bacterium]|jgi:endonuclease/exonuclease/phosphatase family metal-dependent hydrolase